MLAPVWKRNDKKANWLILGFSAVVFIAMMILGRVHLKVNLGFDPHLFAKANAIINTTVAVLLIAALIAVKIKNYKLHRNLMLSALTLSIIFFISYICHHLFAGETRFGDINHDGLISEAEKAAAGSKRIYYILLVHIYHLQDWPYPLYSMRHTMD
jgi:putative membrane protein